MASTGQFQAIITRGGGACMKQWSEDWYRLLSADQLCENLREARMSFEYSSRMGQDAAALMWRFRIMRMEKELSLRADVVA